MKKVLFKLEFDTEDQVLSYLYLAVITWQNGTKALDICVAPGMIIFKTEK